MNMQMNLVKRGTEGELQFNGYIDASNAAEVETILLDVASQFDTLILNMENLEYISSAGLRAFKKVYLEMRKKNGMLCAKNVGKSVMEVLEVTGFTRFFRFL